MILPRPLSDWKVWLLGAVAGLLVVAALAPAKAAACTSTPSVKQGDGSIACWTRDGFGLHLDWCDRDADGHYVYARVSDSVFSRLGHYFTTVEILGDPGGYDRNGSASGCGHLGYLNGQIYAWAVCVQYEGCGPWKGTLSAPGTPARLR